MKIKKSTKACLIFLLISIIISNPLKPHYFIEELFPEPTNLNISDPPSTDFSLIVGTPTRIDEDIYYEVEQPYLDGGYTFYIEIEMNSSEVYLISTSSNSSEYTLYEDAGFTSQITSVNGSFISIAPSDKKFYYIKWQNGNEGELIGFFKAVQLTESEISNGFNISYNNPDWNRSLIYFIMPNCAKCNDSNDINLISPNASNFIWIQIERNSNDAYRVNDTSLDTLKETMLNNPRAGFMLCYGTQGLFKMSFPTPNGNNNTNTDLFWYILIIILSILSFSTIIAISFRVHIGARLKNKISNVSSARHERRQETLRRKQVEVLKKESEIEKKIKVISPPFEKPKKDAKIIIFLSYATLDSNYYQISKIAKQLRKYPYINEVLYWERDSGENIVSYMEKTISKSNVFVLFCSENSKKSKAVEDEWQVAFQLRKKGTMKIIPVFENDDYIPRLLLHLLNVKFTKNDFNRFIENLYREILR